MGRPAMSASCFGEPKRDELPAASSITCRLDAAVLRSSACPCALPCRCAWISAMMASAMLAGSRPPRSRPTGACRRAPNFAAVAAPRSTSKRWRRDAGPSRSDVRNRSVGQCPECREVGRDVMAHDHGCIEPREIQVSRQLRRRGQQHPSCPRKSHRVGVGRPMVRHGHAPAQRGTEFHHRQCVRTTADQQQFARDGTRSRQTNVLVDCRTRRSRWWPNARCPRLALPARRSAAAVVRSAGPDRPPARAWCRRAGPVPLNRARRHTWHVHAARNTVTGSRRAPSPPRDRA